MPSSRQVLLGPTPGMLLVHSLCPRSGAPERLEFGPALQCWLFVRGCVGGVMCRLMRASPIAYRRKQRRAIPTGTTGCCVPSSNAAAGHFGQSAEGDWRPPGGWPRWQGCFGANTNPADCAFSNAEPMRKSSSTFAARQGFSTLPLIILDPAVGPFGNRGPQTESPPPDCQS